MITREDFPGFQIVISEKSDGNFRDISHGTEYKRARVQDHGKEIHVLSQENQNIPFSHTDGVYSRVNDISIGCLTADCPIVVITGDGECGTFHSGWRGTQAQIVTHGLTHFTTPRKNISAYIGPHIRHYEVGSEFLDYFGNQYVSVSQEGFIFNITKKIFDELIENGVPKENILISNIDTFTNPEYHSFRRDGGLCAGFVGVKMLESHTFAK